MKHARLMLAFLVFGATGVAAIFAPHPTNSVTARPQEAAISPPVKATAAVAIETGREPVPYVPASKPPAPQLASLPGPAIAPAETRSAPAPQAKPPQPKPNIARAATQEVSSQVASPCGGRAMKSFVVLGDGSVHVQC